MKIWYALKTGKVKFNMKNVQLFANVSLSCFNRSKIKKVINSRTNGRKFSLFYIPLLKQERETFVNSCKFKCYSFYFLLWIM